MRAGALRHRIDVLTPTSTIGDSGEEVVTWSTLYGGVPACYESVGGNETSWGRQVQSTASAIFGVRYLSEITTECRVRWADRTFEIVRVDDIKGVMRRLIIECMES